MIKILGPEHFDACLEIKQLRPKIGGTVAISDQSFIEGYRKFFEPNDTNFAIGYFENTELVSWISMGIYDSSLRGKFWVVPCFFSKKQQSYFSFNHPDLSMMIKEAFKIAESKQCYTYYYAISERISRVYDKQWQKNSFIQVGRYHLSTLDVVPPNTKPDQSLYWKLMGEELKPDATLIKQRVLKLEFRSS
jgi:hypothetical protein